MATQVKPPRYANAITYEFTIAPDDQFQGYHLRPEQYVGCSTRFIHVTSKMRTLLAKYLAPYGSYRMITEVSEPEVFTPSSLPRVHFHGTVKFNKVIDFLCEGAHQIQKHCTMTINPMRPEYWIDYVAKQQSLIVAAYPSTSDHLIDSDKQKLLMAASTAPGKTIEACFKKSSRSS